jgi:curli biogenesis system outer membrane secretion channel CsgG
MSKVYANPFIQTGGAVRSVHLGLQDRGVKMKLSFLKFLIATGFAITLVGCAHQEESKTLAIPKVESAGQSYSGPRIPISVGKFDNRSSFMRGVFSDSVDRLGSQAQTVLVTHLQQSRRFSVLDRTNMTEIKEEAALQKKAQALKGADYVITGDVSEFGRKVLGDKQLFGILGRGTTQVAYAKVNLNIVNTLTSEVVFSSQGAGEYSLSEREVIGFGGTAGYDSTLNGKVLDLAIRDAVNNLVLGIDSGAWKPGS